MFLCELYWDIVRRVYIFEFCILIFYKDKGYFYMCMVFFFWVNDDYKLICRLICKLVLIVYDNFLEFESLRFVKNF